MRVKLAWLVRVGGERPPPFTTITITSKVAVDAPAEWADTLTLFHLYQYMYSVVHTLARGRQVFPTQILGAPQAYI
jgi:hypothetical protein